MQINVINLETCVIICSFSEEYCILWFVIMNKIAELVVNYQNTEAKMANEGMKFMLGMNHSVI